MSVRVTPQVMLRGQAGAALALWGRAFPGVSSRPSAGLAGLRHVRLGRLALNLFDGPVAHAFGPTPAQSLLVELEGPAEAEGSPLPSASAARC